MHVWLLALFVALVLAPAHLHAAEIRTVVAVDGFAALVIEGPIEAGDALRFLEALPATGNAAVFLRSPGGNLMEGLAVAKLVRRAGFATVVAPDLACESACALIWLAGSTRFMTSSSLIGFHAAYTEESGVAAESGAGNALVGAYMNDLGLSTDAILFATSAGPDGMNYLTIETAQQIGINAMLIEGDALTEPKATPTADRSVGELPLRLPHGFRWIVLASRETAQALDPSAYAPAFASQDLRRVSTRSGFFALVAGPFDRTTAESRLATLAAGGTISKDAYLSSGNGFTSFAE